MEESIESLSWSVRYLFVGWWRVEVFRLWEARLLEVGPVVVVDLDDEVAVER